jgi:bifunctional ADP-heptose synthase (sugar kinase/adenylyltransferase)
MMPVRRRRRRRAAASPASPRPSRAAVAGSGTCDANELVVGVMNDAPTRPTPAFLDALGIAIVCHGDDYAEHQVEDYYGAIRGTHRLVLLPYTPSVSTSEIIARIRRRPV